jgi:aspartate ammonia-lyase
MKTRTETDSLGSLNITVDAYWGIHTQRAIENFRISHYSTPVRLISALAQVKKACALANKELKYLDDRIADGVIKACNDIESGRYNNQFPLDALQGGAGTSTNMNINEVIANLTMESMGFEKGSYNIIDPIEHINLHQSTNDVYPTALKVASINGLKELSEAASALQGAFQEKEKEFASILTIGRTEMQDAVPITLGSQFTTFAEAIARDRWRTFKSEERLRVVNIGGTAVGTGLTAPKKYIFLVIEKLRDITGLGLSRAEQPMDPTANNDVFIEVSGMLDSHASNIIKIATDLRFLHYLGEISLPPVQAGSSIMPGKVNPVILESAIQACMKVSNNHRLISESVSRGTLQINEFMPLIAFAFLESIDLLINTDKMLTSHVNNISADEAVCKNRFESNTAIITAFIPHIGYNKCTELLKEYDNFNSGNFRAFLTEKLGSELVGQVLSPFNLLSLGHK